MARLCYFGVCRNKTGFFHVSDAMPLDSTPLIDSTTDRECPECGLFQSVPALRPGQVADCLRCDATLRRRRRDSLGVVMALSVAGLLLFAIAAVFPLLGLRLAGQERVTTLPGLPVGFERQGLWQLALVVLATTLIAPLAKLLLTGGVIAGLRLDWPAPWLAVMARWRAHLTPWAMIEVFLLGAFVAYTRLAAIASVQVGIALYALGALMVVMIASDAWLDEHALWEAIGRRQVRVPGGHAPAIGCDTCGEVCHEPPGAFCPRCHDRLRTRKPNSLARTWALLLAAVICYIPANAYPVMTVIRFAKGHPSTILGGVQELIEYRMWPLAILVLVASVLVPIMKLVCLSYMLITTQPGGTRRLRDRTRLYRIVDFIGRWSMIDVFMVAILVALVRMGVLASVTPGWGGVFFAAVVILTMLASMSFDPRLMWDAAGPQACDEAQAEAAA